MTDTEKRFEDLAQISATDLNAQLLIDTDASKKSKLEQYHRTEMRKHVEKEKAKEKARIAYEKKVIDSGVPIGRTESAHRHIQEAEQKIAALDRIKDENPLNNFVDEVVNQDIIEVRDAVYERGLPEIAPDNGKLTRKYPTPELMDKATTPIKPTLVRAGEKSLSTDDLKQMRSTSRPDVAKLMTSLNINLDLQLTKSDTKNLLACLLTCNDTQLMALQKNAKIPLAIKTIIKRLRDDAELGNIETIERLWDRIFGKSGLHDTATDTTKESIIPSTPISREAYIVLRDTYMK